MLPQHAQFATPLCGKSGRFLALFVALVAIFATPSGTSLLHAQLMINKGAVIVVKNAGFMQVNGAYQNQTGSIDDSGTVTVTSHFTNNSAATAGGAGRYNIAGNFTNDGTFIRQTGTVNLNGSSNQNVGGTTITTFYDLMFTNGGSKTLTQKEIVDSDAYFTSGIVYTTQTNVLNFTTNGNWVNNAGLPVAPAASYVDGPCEKDANSTTRFWFPVGKNGRGNTGAITPSSSSPTTFRMQYFNYAYVNTTSMQSPLQVISKIQYWHADIVSGTASGIVRLYWIPGDYTMSVYMSTMSNLVVARWDSAASGSPSPAWVTAGVSALMPGATYQSGWIESQTVTAPKFGTYITNRPFTISSITTDNSLPVEMGPFRAKQIANHVDLQWKTESEIQNLGFEIERSRKTDDGSLQPAVMIKSFLSDTALAAKSPYGANYATVDDEGLVQGTYIYELYQIDRDGIRTHAASQTVDFNPVAVSSPLSVDVYPNPTAARASVNVGVQNDSHITAALYDASGNFAMQLADTDMTPGNSTLSIDLSNVPSGIYELLVSSGTSRVAKRVVVAH
jgi:hypothetical protein